MLCESLQTVASLERVSPTVGKLSCSPSGIASISEMFLALAMIKDSVRTTPLESCVSTQYTSADSTRGWPRTEIRFAPAFLDASSRICGSFFNHREIWDWVTCDNDIFSNHSETLLSRIRKRTVGKSGFRLLNSWDEKSLAVLD